MNASLLDATVGAARSELRERGVPDPAVLFLCGTGLPTFASGADATGPSGFKRHGALALDDVQALTAPWRAAELVWGVIDAPGGPANVWLIEDASLEFAPGSERPAFEAGLLVWIAAAAGASVLVHTSAGGALPGSDFQAGELCIVDDYLNLSGRTPLLGVGESALGPLFPDLTRLFAGGLVTAARRQAEQLGISAEPGIAAAAAPVALATPAERQWFRSAGADVWAQGLQSPFLAAAHAGLEVLALIALIDGNSAREQGTSVEGLLNQADHVAPALDELIAHLAPIAAEYALQSA